MRKPNPNDPHLDTEDSGCGHPSLRKTRWEKETRGCFDCHVFARRNAKRDFNAVTFLTAAYILFWAFLLTRRASLKSPLLFFMFQAAVLLALGRWLLSCRKRIRQHTPEN